MILLPAPACLDTPTGSLTPDKSSPPPPPMPSHRYLDAAAKAAGTAIPDCSSHNSSSSEAIEGAEGEGEARASYDWTKRNQMWRAGDASNTSIIVDAPNSAKARRSQDEEEDETSVDSLMMRTLQLLKNTSLRKDEDDACINNACMKEEGGYWLDMSDAKTWENINSQPYRAPTPDSQVPPQQLSTNPTPDLLEMCSSGAVSKSRNINDSDSINNDDNAANDHDGSGADGAKLYAAAAQSVEKLLLELGAFESPTNNHSTSDTNTNDTTLDSVEIGMVDHTKEEALFSRTSPPVLLNQLWIPTPTSPPSAIHTTSTIGTTSTTTTSASQTDLHQLPTNNGMGNESSPAREAPPSKAPSSKAPLRGPGSKFSQKGAGLPSLRLLPRTPQSSNRYDYNGANFVLPTLNSNYHNDHDSSSRHENSTANSTMSFYDNSTYNKYTPDSHQQSKPGIRAAAAAAANCAVLMNLMCPVDPLQHPTPDMYNNSNYSGGGGFMGNNSFYGGLCGKQAFRGGGSYTNATNNSIIHNEKMRRERQEEDSERDLTPAHNDKVNNGNNIVVDGSTKNPRLKLRLKRPGKPGEGPTFWGMWEDERARMVYVSWLPRTARAVDRHDKKRCELILKDFIQSTLHLPGLEKVLLFPPTSAHCKLLFTSELAARGFLNVFGGFEHSPGPTLWKVLVCRYFCVDIKDGIHSTRVRVIWADQTKNDDAEGSQVFNNSATVAAAAIAFNRLCPVQQPSTPFFPMFDSRPPPLLNNNWQH